MKRMSSFVALLAACLLFCLPAFSQGARYDQIVVSARGFPIGGATITVCTSGATLIPTSVDLAPGCTPTTSIFTNPALSTAQANPFKGDGQGNYGFYAAPGTYKVSITGPNVVSAFQPPGGVVLPCVPGAVCVNQGLNPPSAPTVAVIGTTGATSYAYAVISKDSGGRRSVISAGTTVTNGNATLSATNFNRIRWTSVSGATSYDVLKFGSPGPWLLLGNTAALTINDQGQATTAYTVPSASESIPFSTNLAAYFGGGGPWFDVKAPPFNAKGDGVTDDTIAINGAIAAAAGGTGGVVYFPPGVYFCNTNATSLVFPFTGSAGGWVTLLLGGALKLQNTLVLGTPRYVIQGLSGPSGGAGTVFSAIEMGASIFSFTARPLINIGNFNINLKNLNINSFLSGADAVRIGSQPAGINMIDSVSINTTGTGIPLHIIDNIEVYAYRSAFNVTNAVGPHPPAVWIESVANQAQLYRFIDCNFSQSGITLSGTSTILGNLIVSRAELENLNRPFLILDGTTSPSGVQGIYVEHIQNADNLPAPASLTIAAASGAVRRANVVTVTTTTAHGLARGMHATIGGVTDASFNGTFLIQSAPTSTTFTYNQTAASATSGNGAVSFQGASNLIEAIGIVNYVSVFDAMGFSTLNGGPAVITALQVWSPGGSAGGTNYGALGQATNVRWLSPFGIFDTLGGAILPALAVSGANLTNLGAGVNNDVSFEPVRFAHQVFRITGPTAAFSITGLGEGGGNISGRTIMLFNDTGFPMTLSNENIGSLAVNRIRTGSGADLTGVNGAILYYDTTLKTPHWIVIAKN